MKDVLYLTVLFKIIKDSKLNNTDNNRNYFEAIKWLSDMGYNEPLSLDSHFGQSIKKDTKLENFSDNTNNYINSLNKITEFKDLEQFIINSEYLDLSESVKNFNFFDGNINADLMVIGDLLSEEDLKYGKPFQGKVGDLLDLMLKAIKFDRKNTYYTNVDMFNFKFNNEKIEDKTNFFLSILDKQIELISPKIIIMFGKNVTNLLTGNDEEISFSRGKWFKIKTKHKNFSCNAISMFHPSYLLIKPENKKETWEDLKDIRKKFSE